MQKIFLLLIGFCLFACSSQTADQNQTENISPSENQSSADQNTQEKPVQPDACNGEGEGDNQSACSFEEKEPENQRENQTDNPGKTENETDTDSQDLAEIDLNQISFEQFLIEMKEKQSGYYLFGFALCPWCRELYPILEEVIQKMDVSVQYIVTRDLQRKLLYTPRQKEQAYAILKEAMPDNDKGEPTLYVPLLVCMKEGKLLSFHEGTLEGHDAKSESLDETQKEALKKELEQFFIKGNQALKE